MKKFSSQRISSIRRLLYRFGLGIGLALFLWQLWRGAQAIFQPTFQLSQPLYLLAALSLLLLAYALQMTAWSEIIHGLGRPISLSAVLQGYILSFLPRYIPGTVWGYLSRNEWLKSQHETPYFISTLSSVLEMGLFVLTAIVVSLSAYLWNIWPWSLRWMIIFGILILAWPIWAGLKWVLMLLPWKRLPIATVRLNPAISFRCWLNAYLIYFALWGCHGLALLSLLNAFSTNHSGTILTAIFSFSVAWLIGFVVLIVPSGLGVREFVLTSLLVSLSFLDTQTASAVAVTARFAIYLAEIIWLFVGFLIARLRVGQHLVERNS